jgi:hypothetical protein
MTQALSSGHGSRQSDPARHSATLGREAGSGAWARTVVRALDTIWNDCSPADRSILSPLDDFLARHVRELDARRSTDGAEVASWRTAAAPTGAHENNPVATTLIQFVGSWQPPAISRLTSILVNLAIEQIGSDRSNQSNIRTLASILRGDFEHRRNRGHEKASLLLVVVAGSESILDMVGRIERQLTDNGKLVHPRFDQLWRSWLRGQLTRWLASLVVCGEGWSHDWHRSWIRLFCRWVLPAPWTRTTLPS